MSIIDRVLSRSEFVDRPPVLLDIGASGEIHPTWRPIAPYAVCIAFDADTREMGYTVKESSGFRKLYVYNSILTADPVDEADFHLTRFPFCSSLLEPDAASLEKWAFAGHFDLERTVRLRSATLSKVLDDLGVEKVDWFKSDSQGTDLRLFASLGEDRIRRVLAAEFEPGIIDSYRGEDKLWQLLAFMGERPFWMSGLNVRGSQRIGRHTVETCLSKLERRFLHVLLRRSPGWGEVTFLHAFPKDAEYLDLRDVLLGWVFAVVEGQYGFALEVAEEGEARFGDPLFRELKADSLSRLRRGWLKLPLFALRKLVRRVADTE